MSRIADRDFDQLEGQLAATLRPVRPQHAFVQNMRHRIAATSPAIAIRRVPDPSAFLMVLTGVLSAFLLVAALVRVVFFLLSRSK